MIFHFRLRRSNSLPVEFLSLLMATAIPTHSSKEFEATKKTNFTKKGCGKKDKVWENTVSLNEAKNLEYSDNKLSSTSNDTNTSLEDTERNSPKTPTTDKINESGETSHHSGSNEDADPEENLLLSDSKRY